MMRIVFQKDDLNINSSESYCPRVFRIHQGSDEQEKSLSGGLRTNQESGELHC